MCSNIEQEFFKHDYRKNSIYKNTELIFDQAVGEVRGTILLIHGTAPQNIDGQLANQDLCKTLEKEDPLHYIVQPTYKMLAENLNNLGWNTVRYTRLGVYQKNVDISEYSQTDLKNIMNQLKIIWAMIPSDKPKIAFAWSGGSVHILQLPLETANAIVIFGGISTKRLDVFKLRAKNERELKEIEARVAEILGKEGNVSRTEMAGIDMPYGRMFDENNLKPNWEYLSPHNKLPVLILHGGADAEADISQADVWKGNLPDHDIEVIIKKSGNHAFGVEGNKPDMQDLASTVNSWLQKRCIK